MHTSVRDIRQNRKASVQEARESNRLLVSSVIIFLNAEKFIEEAVESVFCQTYKNWELILVDDGSTDYSTDIAQRYVAHYPNKVRYVEHQDHQNRGMSASRNLGVHHSIGDYIAFLDADDIWLSHKLERQLEILETHQEVAAAFSPWQEWLSCVENDHAPDLVQNLGVEPNSVIQPAQLVPLWLKGDSAIPGHCGSLWRRRVILHAGGFDDSFRDYYEDLVLLIKVHLEAPVYVGGECLSKYRQHEGSSCALMEKSGKDREAKLKFYQWLEDYLRKKNIHEKTIWESLQMQLFPYRRPTLHRFVQFILHAKRQWNTLLAGLARKFLPVWAYHWLKTQWHYRKTSEALKSE
ncbi:glycosyltransferase family 2 protein [Candidatus Nitrospira salsa]